MDTNLWWVVTAAAVPSVASGLWVFWRWWLERNDKRKDSTLTREQASLRDLETQRAALVREHADLFDRMRAELLRALARLVEMERDRDRGWDLARWWHRRAHELRLAGLNAQVMVAGLSAREEVPVPAWPDMTVPVLEGPKPDAMKLDALKPDDPKLGDAP